MSRPSCIDDYAAIREHRDRISREAEPKCPLSEVRPLYDCLRSVTRCSDACPLHDRWIGPDGSASAVLRQHLPDDGWVSAGEVGAEAPR